MSRNPIRTALCLGALALVGPTFAETTALSVWWHCSYRCGDDEVYAVRVLTDRWDPPTAPAIRAAAAMCRSSLVLEARCSMERAVASYDWNRNTPLLRDESAAPPPPSVQPPLARPDVSSTPELPSTTVDRGDPSQRPIPPMVGKTPTPPTTSSQGANDPLSPSIQ